MKGRSTIVLHDSSAALILKHKEEMASRIGLDVVSPSMNGSSILINNCEIEAGFMLAGCFAVQGRISVVHIERSADAT